jgi:hypothetical protein
MDRPSIASSTRSTQTFPSLPRRYHNTFSAMQPIWTHQRRWSLNTPYSMSQLFWRAINTLAGVPVQSVATRHSLPIIN